MGLIKHAITTHPEVNEVVINEFRVEYQYNELILPLGDNNDVCESMRGLNIENELIEFSHRYSNLTFILYCEVENTGTLYKRYIKNGILMASDIRLVEDLNIDGFLSRYDEVVAKRIL